MKAATLWLATSTEKVYGQSARARRSTEGAVRWKERTLETWTLDRRTGAAGVTQRRAEQGRRRPRKVGGGGGVKVMENNLLEDDAWPTGWGLAAYLGLQRRGWPELRGAPPLDV